MLEVPQDGDPTGTPFTLTVKVVVVNAFAATLYRIDDCLPAATFGNVNSGSSKTGLPASIRSPNQSLPELIKFNRSFS